MGLYRDETGRVLELDDRFASARGYAPLSDAEHEDINAQAGITARGEERGVVGDINAGLTGLESGLTLGASDVVLGESLPPIERQRLQAELEAHPYLRAGGELVGGVAPALLTGGVRTPTGYLSSVTGAAAEAGLEQGGIVGTAKALGAMGAEGAIQNAGQYIGHASIEDKELTAEGLSGAVGTGFEFGTLGGGAAVGVAKGTMAARRMFSRVMGGEKAAKAAESAWSIASEEALQADTATAQAAEIKLNEIRRAKIEAQRYRNEARSMTQEEKIRAAAAEPTPADFEAGIPTNVVPRETGTPTSVFKKAEEPVGPTPLDEGIAPAKGGMPTSVFKKPEEFVGPTPLDEGIAPAEGGQVTSVRAPTTKKIPRPAVEPMVDKTPPTALEEQLAGTKAALDEGAVLKDIKARRADTIEEISYNATKDLLGPAVAKEERVLQSAMDEYSAARKELEQILARGETPVIDTYGTGDGGMPVKQYDQAMGDIRAAGEQSTRAGSPGKRQAIEILDDAHEEALLRAKDSADPALAGKAISEADEFEKLLEHLAVPRVVEKGQPLSRGELKSANAEQWIQELMGDVEKVSRYEKASAKLADALGEQAHPTSILKAQGLRDAEREGERRVMDRSARAVDDAQTFGPEYASPKERVRYARERQVDAQRKVDELSAQEKEAGMAHAEARKKMRVGEKAKKAALRSDAKIAAKAGKLGAQDVGGMLEMLDLPGLPKPSDLPVVGPLLGAYLKFRTLKRAMGRMMGKVPATADNRVAALASQTRDRVARAMDRTLGVLEKGAKSATRVAPAAAGILSARIYDDGEPDAKKGASVQALAAVRIRELAAYVHAPGAIENDVRFELREVSDPDVIDAVEKHRRQVMEWLLNNAPKAPEQGMLNQIDWEPSGAEAMSFARRFDAATHPADVFERLAHEQSMISLEAAEALRENYPKLFGEAQQRLMERAAENRLKVPLRQRIQLSLLFKTSLDPALDPDNLRITQSVYERKVMNPAPGMPGTPPVPAVANPVNMSEAFTNAADRR